MITPHILFIGENWHGSNSTSCKRAFRYLGCDVFDLDDFHFFPRWQSIGMRGLRKIIRPLIYAEFGNYIRRLSRELKPDLVFVFKGLMVRPETIEYCKGLGALIFNFYPDWDFGQYYAKVGNDFAQCMITYDALFTPKSYQIDKLYEIGANRVEFLPYAYDPWCHYPVTLSIEELKKYQSDITFVGTWGPERAAFLEQLVTKNFPFKLTIWGNQWENLGSHSPLRKYIKWMPAYGETQARIFAGCKIALSFLRPPDIHTARTFEIPAFKTFMLAQYSAEQSKFFIVGKEIDCFETVDELRNKINYYIMNDDKRIEIASAGYLRVINDKNSYVDRMQQVLTIYHELNG